MTMATPADQRLLELLGKWLKSLELHTKYSSLDDDSYWKIQPWVEHQRPSRWIIDVAKQKTLALKAHVEERVKTGDSKYSDSLELMIFLANLVGSEHIERFIPLADPEAERSLTAERPNAAADPTADTATREMPLASATATQEAPLVSATATREMPAVSASATREMPKFLAAKRAPPPAGTAQVARTERKAAVPAKPAARPAAKQPAKPARPSGKPAPKITPAAPPERDGSSDVARAQVIADAARLVQWGRKWYELPELIARMADRPTLPEVRRILKENKSAIDAKAGGA
ncbi:MAG TPA: hypothetical protein VNX69_03150 [Steroidobacteraceae bacterium]|nr:hypothetical protein [Steroidobacteraceae bacterium]